MISTFKRFSIVHVAVLSDRYDLQTTSIFGIPIFFISIFGFLLWIPIVYTYVKKMPWLTTILSLLSAVLLFFSVGGLWLYLFAGGILCIAIYTKQKVFYIIATVVILPCSLYFLIGGAEFAKLYSFINFLPFLIFWLQSKKFGSRCNK